MARAKTHTVEVTNVRYEGGSFKLKAVPIPVETNMLLGKR
jgi:hypothetical protein